MTIYVYIISKGIFHYYKTVHRSIGTKVISIQIIRLIVIYNYKLRDMFCHVCNGVDEIYVTAVALANLWSLKRPY